MALFHLSVTQTKRSAGQSAIASAAYRAGERLYSEYYGEYSDYTRKGVVICSYTVFYTHLDVYKRQPQTSCSAVGRFGDSAGHRQGNGDVYKRQVVDAVEDQRL